MFHSLSAAFHLLRLQLQSELHRARVTHRMCDLPEVRLIRHNYTPEDLRTALAFLTENYRLPFDALVADWPPLTEADEAFRRAKDLAVFRMGIRS